MATPKQWLELIEDITRDLEMGTGVLPATKNPMAHLCDAELTAGAFASWLKKYSNKPE